MYKMHLELIVLLLENEGSVGESKEETHQLMPNDEWKTSYKTLVINRGTYASKCCYRILCNRAFWFSPLYLEISFLPKVDIFVIRF